MRQTKQNQGLDHDPTRNYVPPAFTDSILKSDDVWAHSSAVEHLTFNQRVVGSNPAGLTNIKIILVGIFRKHNAGPVDLCFGGNNLRKHS